MAEYIKRDFLISKLMEHLRKYPNACYSASEIILILNNVPTADVVEVKHGEWLIKCDDYDCELMCCSICESEFYDGDNDTVDNLHNYCPNCGAKMDGKEGAEE